MKPARPLVYVESPYAGDRVAHRSYLKICILDSISRGENPYASHAFFTQFLDDNVPAERAQGIDLGNQWRLVCDRSVFYTDLGISPGMAEGIIFCHDRGLLIEYRKIL